MRNGRTSAHTRESSITYDSTRVAASALTLAVSQSRSFFSATCSMRVCRSASEDATYSSRCKLLVFDLPNHRNLMLVPFCSRHLRLDAQRIRLDDYRCRRHHKIASAKVASAHEILICRIRAVEFPSRFAKPAVVASDLVWQAALFDPRNQR